MNFALDRNFDSMVSIGNNLKSEISTISSMSQLMMANRNITNYLQKTSKHDARDIQYAMTSIYDISNTFNYVDSVYLYRLDKNYIHITNGITIVKKSIVEDESWLKEIVDSKGGYVLRVNGGGAFYKKSGAPILSFIRVVNNIETQKPLGMLVINLSYDILEDTYKDITSDNKQFLYYDNNLNIINQEMDQELLHDISITHETFQQATIGSFGNEKVLSYYHIPNMPFIIAGIEKMSYIKTIPMEAGWIIISLVLLTVISLILIGVFISVSITTPIQRLVQSMDIAKRGWLRRVSFKLPNDEIGHLKNSYNEMLVAINQLINELLEKEKSMQKAELDVLHEQIKPHFLYNTLDTIAYLALQESSEKVYDALETLGNFYRRFLSSGSTEITIKEEINIIKDYLKLQKLRYDDILDDEYDIQEDLWDIKIPKLILQPLVENSLYHGIRLKGERGLIKITIYKKEGKLYIIVYDDGVGIDEEVQKQMIYDNNNSKSFGFKGTIERIQYYYGIEDVYEIQSEEGRYTQVIIKIPC